MNPTLPQNLPMDKALPFLKLAPWVLTSYAENVLGQTERTFCVITLVYRSKCASDSTEEEDREAGVGRGQFQKPWKC